MLKQRIRNTYCIFLVFLYVFAFNIVGIIDSSIIAAVLLIPSFFLIPEMRSHFFNIILSKNFRTLIVTFVLFFLWIIFAVKINGQNDFSFIDTLVHLLLVLVIGALLFSYFVATKRNSTSIVNWVIWAFVIQSIIIVLAILFPQIRELILKTKPEEVIVRAQHYGYRGVSLSSSSFFGLSISFGLILLFFFEKDNQFFKNNNLIRLLAFAFLFIGACSAGRTALIGLAFGIVVYFLQSFRINKKQYISKQKFTKAFFGVVIFALILIVVVYLLITQATDNNLRIIQNFITYLTEFFSDSSGGMFHTTSSDYLLSNMLFLVDFPTFLKGDGRYSVGNVYYMGTDSGYMRPLLYCGIFALVFLFVIQNQILNFCQLKKRNKMLYWIIFLYIFVLQIKGEVLGFAIMFNSCLFLLVLSYGYQVEPKNDAKRLSEA